MPTDKPDFAALADRWLPDFRAELSKLAQPLLDDDALRARLCSMLAATAALCRSRRTDPTPPPASTYQQLGELARKFYRRPGDDPETFRLVEPADGLQRLLGPTIYGRFQRERRLLRLWRPEALGSAVQFDAEAEPCPVTRGMLAAVGSPLLCLKAETTPSIALDGADVLRELPNTKAKLRESGAKFNAFPKVLHGSDTTWSIGAAYAHRYTASVDTEDWLPAFRAFDVETPWRLYLTLTVAAVSSRLLVLTDGKRLMASPVT